MCGILCAFKISCHNKDISEVLTTELVHLLQNRGPDSHNKLVVSGDILFAGFVLWHQGEYLTEQPLKISNNILVFNGDIFNLPENITTSDTEWLLTKLNECQDDENRILEIFRTCKGPYCFVYYNNVTKCLYFGRDSLGRNSLLIEKEDDIVKIVSVSYYSSDQSKTTIELPSYGIYKICMDKKDTLTLFPWKNLQQEQIEFLQNDFKNVIPFSNLNYSKAINPDWLMSYNINILDSLESYNFYEILKENNISNKDFGLIFEELLKNESVNKTVNQLLNILDNSVQQRVTKVKHFCKICKDDKVECNSKIGILFSGGIDCTILAAIAHKFIDPSLSIDLINVAFDKDTIQEYLVPDRITARNSYDELKSLYPQRDWNLIEVNVKRSDLLNNLKTKICKLIYPLNTVLDESIGCAFWYGSESKGIILDSKLEFTSHSKVLIVGIGADELFGGYTRHRNSFQRCKGDLNEKLKCLENELEFDWNRLSTRNLGRDDRVIGDHGRTARAPFIEENLIQFVRRLKSSQKCCFLLDQGIGDKLLLRLCGYKIGLRKCVSFKKRAIQFGSRIANKNQNAKDISKFLNQS